MREKTYQVFKFNELSQEAKDYAMQKYYESEDYYFLKEDIRQELIELDKFKVFENVELSYSLSCCQGDGLSFKADINWQNFLKAKKISQKTIDKMNDYIYKFFSSGNTGRYYYASNSDIQWEDQGSNMKEALVDKIDALRDEIAEYYLDICKKLEKYGYSILEYRMTEAEFLELCESNDYEFTADGRLD